MVSGLIEMSNPTTTIKKKTTWREYNLLARTVGG
jgi:hypothetical protein